MSIASQTVEFWIIPYWDFLIRLLASLGLHGFRNGEAVSLSKSQAIASFGVPVFSEYLQTVRYQKLKILATTRRLGREERLPIEAREEVMRLATQGLSIPSIVERRASSNGLLISFEAAQRWARKAGHRGSLALRQGEDEDAHEKY